MGGMRKPQFQFLYLFVFKLATFSVALTTLCIKLNQVSSLNTGNFICKCPLNLNWPILLGGRIERESLALIKITC